MSAPLASNDFQKLLKIVSKGMVYDNLSTVCPMWEYWYGLKKDKPEGRELRYEVRTELGYPAVGSLAMDGAVFHAGNKSKVLEAVAYHKKFGATIEVENSIVELALRDFSAYGKPIALEVEAKGIALARDLSRQAYADGTGAIGQFDGSDADTTIHSGLTYDEFTITVSEVASERGFVGWFNKGDRLYAAQADGTSAMSVNGGTAIEYLVVASVDRPNNGVRCKAYNSSNVQIDVNSLSGTDVGSAASEHYLYRYGKGTPATALATVDADTAYTYEYSTLSRDMVGLRGLASSSAILVHGLQHSDQVTGTSYSGSGALDSQDFQEAMSLAEIAVGEGRYTYKNAFMAPEQYNVIVESRETDRRFNSWQDSDRGTNKIGYHYNGSRIAFKPDPFCPTYEIWIPPEGDVLQYHGTDFAPVKPQGMPAFHFAIDSSTSRYKDVVQEFMSGMGVGICVHPEAVIRVKGFTP